MKHLGLVFSFSLLVLAASAQDFRIGVGAGIDRSAARVVDAQGSGIEYKNDFAGGIAFEAVLSSIIGLQLEANYSKQGGAIIIPAGGGGLNVTTLNLDYVTIPLLVKLYATPRLSFYAGPQLSVLTEARARLSTSTETQNLEEALESTDIAAVFGGEYRFDNGIFISGRYTQGMTNIVSEGGPLGHIRNQYMSFRVGYSFKL